MAEPTLSQIKTCFAAVADARTRVVVLGSLPGEVSLQRREYYAQPTNQFWRLMQGVTGAQLVGRPYAERLETLLAAGVGLWDVIGSARRVGSLDARIRDHTPNALKAFAKGLPSLRALAFNGATSLKIGRAQLGETVAWPMIALPSSSAAYAAMSLERKQIEWMRLRAFLSEAD